MDHKMRKLKIGELYNLVNNMILKGANQESIKNVIDYMHSMTVAKEKGLDYTDPVIEYNISKYISMYS